MENRTMYQHPLPIGAGTASPTGRDFGLSEARRHGARAPVNDSPYAIAGVGPDPYASVSSLRRGNGPSGASLCCRRGTTYCETTPATNERFWRPLPVYAFRCAVFPFALISAALCIVLLPRSQSPQQWARFRSTVPQYSPGPWHFITADGLIHCYTNDWADCMKLIRIYGPVPLEELWYSSDEIPRYMDGVMTSLAALLFFAVSLLPCLLLWRNACGCFSQRHANTRQGCIGSEVHCAVPMWCPSMIWGRQTLSDEHNVCFILTWAAALFSCSVSVLHFRAQLYRVLTNWGINAAFLKAQFYGGTMFEILSAYDVAGGAAALGILSSLLLAASAGRVAYLHWQWSRQLPPTEKGIVEFVSRASTASSTSSNSGSRDSSAGTPSPTTAGATATSATASALPSHVPAASAAASITSQHDQQQSNQQHSIVWPREEELTGDYAPTSRASNAQTGAMTSSAAGAPLSRRPQRESDSSSDSSTDSSSTGSISDEEEGRRRAPAPAPAARPAGAYRPGSAAAAAAAAEAATSESYNPYPDPTVARLRAAARLPPLRPRDVKRIRGNFIIDRSTEQALRVSRASSSGGNSRASPSAAGFGSSSSSSPGRPNNSREVQFRTFTNDRPNPSVPVMDIGYTGSSGNSIHSGNSGGANATAVLAGGPVARLGAAQLGFGRAAYSAAEIREEAASPPVSAAAPSPSPSAAVRQAEASVGVSAASNGALALASAPAEPTPATTALSRPPGVIGTPTAGPSAGSRERSTSGDAAPSHQAASQPAPALAPRPPPPRPGRA